MSKHTKRQVNKLCFPTCVLLPYLSLQFVFCFPKPRWPASRILTGNVSFYWHKMTTWTTLESRVTRHATYTFLPEMDTKLLLTLKNLRKRSLSFVPFPMMGMFVKCFPAPFSLKAVLPKMLVPHLPPPPCFGSILFVIFLFAYFISSLKL